MQTYTREGIKHGVDVNARDSSHYTPLQIACSELRSVSKAHEIAFLLLDKGASINSEPDAGGKTVLHWEAANGRMKLVDLLINRGGRSGRRVRNRSNPFCITR